MAWSDDIALLNLRIAKEQRLIDWFEGANENLFGPRGANADWSNPAHTDGCDPDDAVQAAHRHRCTGGANAYFAWWRTEFPDADETSTGVEGVMYEMWNDWNTNLSQDIANDSDYTDTLATHKASKAAFITKRDALQAKIDNGDLDGDPNA
tara:strand:+ start:1584 stop:2036 length:453 start_codon:yes stop_codon:yes gene_type:complete